MWLIVKISLRNLLRQKRRNILLGIGIAIGMMLLVIANSFSRGITDTLLNKVIANVAGHIQVEFREDGRRLFSLCRDKYRLFSIISNTLKDVVEIREMVIGIGRAIGNGKSDLLGIVGIDVESVNVGKYEEIYNVLEGNFSDFTNNRFEFPIIISEEKAKSLNVKLYDRIRIKTTTIYGQQQTATLTVVLIARSANMFYSMAGFMRINQLKNLLGYKPWETSGVYITLKNPSTTIQQANLLHKALEPDLMSVFAEVKNKNYIQNAMLFGFITNTNVFSNFLLNSKIIEGSIINSLTNPNCVIISKNLARELRLKLNDKIIINYTKKYEKDKYQKEYIISAIVECKDYENKNFILAYDQFFYKEYNNNLPISIYNYKKNDTFFIPDNNSYFYKIIAKEWKLLERSKTTEELEEKIRKLRRSRWRGTAVDVGTMYESASSIINLEYVLNLITLIAVLILFFIVLIGVVNTLRMTIKERTREIGTVRAIGMQKKDILLNFITETLLLSFFASVVGIILAFIVMKILSNIVIETENPLNILLVNKRLHFVTTFSGIIFNIFIILIISAVTAYFPSRRASEMNPVEALRHYE